MFVFYSQSDLQTAMFIMIWVVCPSVINYVQRFEFLNSLWKRYKILYIFLNNFVNKSVPEKCNTRIEQHFKNINIVFNDIERLLFTRK